MKKSLFSLIIFSSLTVSCVNSKFTTNEVVVDTDMEPLLFPKGEYVLTGGDAAISIVIDKKKSLWLWGDSYLGKSTGGDTRESLIPNVFGNVFVLLDGDSARTIYGGTPDHPQPVIASEPVDGKHAVYWPHHGFLKDGVIHLFAARYVFGGQNMWDFYCHALLYFRLSYPDFQLIDRQELASYPINQVTYGFGVYEHRGHYYFYGNH